MLVKDVEDRLFAVFGRDDLCEQLGFHDLDKLLESLIFEIADSRAGPIVKSKNVGDGPITVVSSDGLPHTETEGAGRPAHGVISYYERTRKFGYIDDGSGSDVVFHLMSVHHPERRFIRNGATVSFIREENERGGVAKEIRVERRHPSGFSSTAAPIQKVVDPKLLTEVRQYVLELLSAKGSKEGILALTDLGQALRNKFPEHPRIHEVLGYASLGGLVGSISEAIIEGQGPQMGARLRHRATD